ncbi:BlaI/MecI/CopY family transcriptional regulator [candidate division KSB1 bacterium]|nr:BlaI/MecI/CopY family transcriptional regulator [candidate division KSB1 bacterium]NIR69699.1 BlaI/MecI/CopY family transcriptional regulator [candidate division KSB1 bacterium]NIS24895.1 BlaI/MecI/CopY family transcriptional regulator [candidate division KSB1 bacterium]NIT69744.1 BlaI/MecI/CopY family transcriptional regulator [candidate division KSB1 bacterium]NIU23414.1 BlaI/MecI/CopY family transcriptional regulator [candidate division KSB1 bacterium]
MTGKKYSFTFNPSKKGLRKILGDLESDIMKIVWAKGEVTVRSVCELLKESREVAYTTVMTVMSRLAEKGLLEKVKEGNAFVYRATATEEEFTQSTLKKIINGLLSDFSAPAISQFLDSMEDVGPEKLDELARMIEQKRKNRDV